MLSLVSSTGCRPAAIASTRSVGRNARSMVRRTRFGETFSRSAMAPSDGAPPVRSSSYQPKPRASADEVAVWPDRLGAVHEHQLQLRAAPFQPDGNGEDKSTLRARSLSSPTADPVQELPRVQVHRHGVWP